MESDYTYKGRDVWFELRNGQYRTMTTLEDGKELELLPPRDTSEEANRHLYDIFEISDDMALKVVDVSIEEIRKELSNARDFTDRDGKIWRVCLNDMRIKYKMDPKGQGWKLHKKYEDVRKLSGDWQRITTRLAPDDVESLPATIAGYESSAVLSQYKRAISGTLEIIRFGAMLIEIDTCITRDTGPKARFSSKGDAPSLKGWMDANCPEINYRTAIRYKTLAQGLQDMFSIPAKLPLSAALPAPDGSVDINLPEGCKVSAKRVEKIQIAVWEMVEGKSARQLTFDFGLADPKPRGGAHNKPKNLTKEEKYQQQIDDAQAVFREHLDALCDHIRRHHHLLLPAASIESSLTKIDVIRHNLKDAAKKKEA